jgi:hypothetical protein
MVKGNKKMEFLYEKKKVYPRELFIGQYSIYLIKPLID